MCGVRQVTDGGDWFQKTTTFVDRENNDPLAPVRKELRAAKASESRMVGVERDSNNWYKNQEKKRSMFGRTLNPLTGYAFACVCSCVLLCVLVQAHRRACCIGDVMQCRRLAVSAAPPGSCCA